MHSLKGISMALPPVALAVASYLLLPAHAAGLLEDSARAPKFALPNPEYVEHWWYNFGNPPYCMMIVCHGQCARRGSLSNGCRLVPLFPILPEAGSIDLRCTSILH